MVTIVHIAVLFVNTNVAMILNLGPKNKRNLQILTMYAGGSHIVYEDSTAVYL